MSASVIREQGLIRLKRIGDVSFEQRQPPGEVKKLFPKSKPPKGAPPDEIWPALDDVWYRWQTVAPKVKGEGYGHILEWVIDGRYCAARTELANAFVPSFDVAARRALVASEGQVFEIALDTGDCRAVFGAKGSKVIQLVAHLRDGRVLIGESTSGGKRLTVHDERFETRYQTFADGHLLVVDGRVLLGGARTIRVLGLGPSDVRELAKFDGWVQAPSVDGGHVTFNSKDGRYELAGAKQAWKDCFELGNAGAYPVYLPDSQR